MDGPEKLTIFLNGQNFIQKNNSLLLVLRPRCQNQRTFCADSPIFWDISSRIWRKNICTFRTNRISPVRTDFPNLVYIGIFLNSREKPHLFSPPPKKQTKREGTRIIETLGPKARSHPKRRWWHKRSAAVYRHPMERNQWRRYQIQPWFPSEHKGPLMFLREFCFGKKSEDLFFVGGAGVWKVLRSVCVR